MSEQSMAALAQANERRAKIASIKRQLRATAPKPAALELLADMLVHSDSEALGAMRVEVALEACYHVGARTARSILVAVQLSGRVRIRDLSVGRRRRLAAVIREQAAQSSAVAA